MARYLAPIAPPTDKTSMKQLRHAMAAVTPTLLTFAIPKHWLASSTPLWHITVQSMLSSLPLVPLLVALHFGRPTTTHGER
jgi:hypothetical protein